MLKTQLETKHKNTNMKISITSIVTELKKLKKWQNSKIPIVTKLKNSNCDKTQKPK